MKTLLLIAFIMMACNESDEVFKAKNESNYDSTKWVNDGSESLFLGDHIRDVEDTTNIHKDGLQPSDPQNGKPE